MSSLTPYQGRSDSSKLKFLNRFLFGGIFLTWIRIPYLDPLTQLYPDPIRIRNTACTKTYLRLSPVWIILSLQWFDSLSFLSILFGSDKKYGEIFQAVWSDNSVLHGNYSLWTISQVFPTPSPPLSPPQCPPPPTVPSGPFCCNYVRLCEGYLYDPKCELFNM